MERDSNPRNPYEFAGFQNRCLKPLSHPSVRGIVANSADFSSRIGAEAVQLPPKSKSSPPGMIQPSPLRKGTSSLSRRTAQKSGSQFFSLAGESTRNIPGSRGDLQERPRKLIPRRSDYPRQSRSSIQLITPNANRMTKSVESPALITKLISETRLAQSPAC